MHLAYTSLKFCCQFDFSDYLFWIFFQVKFSVFLVYLKSVGVLLGVSTIVFYILTNAANIYSNIWLSEWSNDANKMNKTNGTYNVDTAKRDMRLGIYGLLGVIQGKKAFLSVHM